MINCSKCGNSIPEDSLFCPFCGDDIKKQKAAAVKKEQAVKTAEKPKKGSGAWTIVLSILCVALIGVAGYESYLLREGQRTLQEKEERIQELTDELGEKYAAIAKNESSILTLNNAIDKLGDQINVINEKYDQLVTVADGLEYGTSSPYFYSSNYVVVLKNRGSSKDVTITANFKGSRELNADVVGVTTTASWADKWDGTTIKLNLSPVTVGTSIVEVSNTANSKIIYILVIVTE